MAADYLSNFVQTLHDWGVTDVLLPFILIFTVVFAVMQKIKPLGDKKNFNVIIAVVMALAAVIPHVLGKYPANGDVVVIIGKAIPYTMVIIVAQLAFFILGGLVGIKPDDYKESSYSLIVLILLNVLVINAYPSIAEFFLIVSVYLIVLTLILGGPGLGRVPVIALTAVFIIFHWAATGWTGTSLPVWLSWLEYQTSQVLIVGILTFFTVMSFVMKQEKK